MLVLSRRRDESIMIGDEVEVTVVEVRGDVVKLGVKAPRSVPVHRKEIYETIQRENLAATKASKTDISKILKAVRARKDKGSEKTPPDA